MNGIRRPDTRPAANTAAELIADQPDAWRFDERDSQAGGPPGRKHGGRANSRSTGRLAPRRMGFAGRRPARPEDPRPSYSPKRKEGQRPEGLAPRTDRPPGRRIIGRASADYGMDSCSEWRATPAGNRPRGCRPLPLLFPPTFRAAPSGSSLHYPLSHPLHPE